jgi:hypothetical protein
MSEVGALIVKLRAETAEFREDMGKVKSELDSLKDKTGEVGSSMDHSMGEARGGLMLVEESVGVRLPRHLNTLIATIPGVGQAFALMLPIAGVAVAIEIISKLIEHQKQVAEQAQKLGLAQASFGTAAQEAFNKLDDKLLQAGIHADELRGDHLAALQKQLVLIDHQSMNELAEQFRTLAAAADKTLADISEHWYESKIGVVGVKDALNNFESQYTQLLAKHDDKGAGDLLAGTLQSAIKMKELMEAQQGGHGSTQSDLDAQNALINLLQTEVDLRKQNAVVVLAEKKEATDKAVKETVKDVTDRQKELNASIVKGMENYVAFGRAQREAYKGSNNSEALHQTEDFFKSIADAQKIAAQEELQTAQQTFSNQAEVAKASLEQQKGAIANASELGLISRREAVQQEIALIQHESGVRLVALAQEVAAKRRAVQEEIDSDNRAAANVLGANNGDKSDPKYIAFLNDAANKMAQLDAITNKYNADVKVATTTAATQVAGLNTQLAKLYPTWQQFFKEMNKDVSTLAQSIHGSLQSSVTKFNESFSQGIAKSIVEAKSLSSALKQIGREIVEDAIANFIRWKLMNAEKAGAAEFSNALAEGTPLPIAVAEGAGAFAKALAFEQGGTIPGAGAVPIIGHGGETVVTKALTDRVNAAEGRGGSASGVHMHNTFAPQIHAVDAEGVDRLLVKHASTFQRHMVSAARKMNKR